MPDSKCNQKHLQYPAVKQAVQTLLLSNQSCTLKDFEARYPKLATLFERDSLRNQIYRTKKIIEHELKNKGVKLSDTRKTGLKEIEQRLNY